MTKKIKTQSLLLFSSIYRNFAGIPIDRKGLARGFIYLLLFSFFIFFLSHINTGFAETLNMTCVAGGPYLGTSTVIISGNITDSTTTPQVSDVNISINGTSKVTTSDSSGAYYFTFPNFIPGNYTVIGTANASGMTNVSCSESFRIESASATLECRSKTIQFTGTVIEAGSGSVITSGSVTSTIVDTNSTGTATIQSNGQFTVNVIGCLKYGTRYLVTNIFEDNLGRRGWFNFIYVPT